MIHTVPDLEKMAAEYERRAREWQAPQDRNTCLEAIISGLCRELADAKRALEIAEKRR